MEAARARTPGVPLQQVFLRAAAGVPDEDGRGEVVAEALSYLQQGFDAHYAAPDGVADDDVLVGDNAYAWAVETISRLDEPRFVAVAGRMIRDGAGEISAGKNVSLDLWVPHLADLLRIISGEDEEASISRVRRAAEEVAP